MARRRRRSKAKQQEFLQALISLIAFVGFFGTFYLTESIKISISVAFIFVGILIVTMIIRQINHVNRIKRSGIDEIDRMEGKQFEHYLAHLFKSHGYGVKITPAAGDYGADLVLKKDGKKIVLQAKRYSKNVGIEAVQQVHSSKSYYGADEAWVISNRDYTKPARNLAEKNNVKLIDRTELIDMVLKMNPAALTPKQVINEHLNMICDRCGKPMVIRKSAKGMFYGCSGFPKCRNVKDIESNTAKTI